MSRMSNLVVGGLIALNVGSCAVAINRNHESIKARRELAVLKDAVASEAIVTAVESKLVSSEQIALVGSCIAGENPGVFAIITESSKIALPVCTNECGNASLDVGTYLGMKAYKLSRLSGIDEAKEIVDRFSVNPPAEFCPGSSSDSDEPKTVSEQNL